jgi:hypothetical protein
MQQEIAHPIPQRGAAGLSVNLDITVRQPLPQEPNLSTLPRPLDSFERDQQFRTPGQPSSRGGNKQSRDVTGKAGFTPAV